MNPFTQQVIGALVRQLLVWLSAWLVAHNLPAIEDGQMAAIVSAATPAIASLAWSLWHKYKGRQKLLTALASNRPMTERQVETVIALGGAASVTTQKSEMPT